MPSSKEWSGQVALVTGASGSIGAEVSRVLAAGGASVGVVGRDREALDGLVAEIEAAGGTAQRHVADVRDAEMLADVVAALPGPVDVLVPLAGGDGAPSATAELDPVRWRAVIETDLTSVFLTVHAALPGMLASGRGVIVTVASTAGRRPSGANAAYAAAKAGVVMLTEHLAKEYASAGIRVNCVAPSIVETAKLRSRMPASALAGVASQVPLGRIGQPADVAAAIAYLASDAASWVTGTTLDVTGGMTL